MNQTDIPTIIKSIWASMTRCKDSLLENGWLNIYPNHLNGKVTTFSLTGNKLVFNAFISMYILTLLTCSGGGGGSLQQTFLLNLHIKNVYEVGPPTFLLFREHMEIERKLAVGTIRTPLLFEKL